VRLTRPPGVGANEPAEPTWGPPSAYRCARPAGGRCCPCPGAKRDRRLFHAI